MVALLDKSPLPSKTALRARAATSSFTSRRVTAVKSSNRTELSRFTYDACDRLGSCSNELIGGSAGLVNLYVYVDNSPIYDLDPSGNAKCRPTLQRGETARNGDVNGPGGPLQERRGRYFGRIKWRANDSGVTLGSELEFGRQKEGVVRGLSQVAVDCICDNCKCKAAPVVNVLGDFGIGFFKIGDERPKIDPKDPDPPVGTVGTQDRFRAVSALGGVALGDTITVEGIAWWTYTARVFDASLGLGIRELDTIVTKSERVSFTWKCVGTCPDTK